MSPKRPEPADQDALYSRAYEITVDDGEDTFCALSIECVDRETEWLISDTVYALDNMR